MNQLPRKTIGETPVDDTYLVDAPSIDLGPDFELIKLVDRPNRRSDRRFVDESVYPY